MRKFMQARWAELSENGTLFCDDSERPFQMSFSQGSGQPLLSDGNFGADIVQFSAGKCVETHIHEGDHILFVLNGTGIVEYYDKKHSLCPGMCYFIPGDVPHAIRAKTNLVLIAVGNNHQHVYSESRLTIVH